MTKRCLRKVLGKSLRQQGVFENHIGGNRSRHKFQADSPRCFRVLTPSHILNGERLTTQPTGPEPTVHNDLQAEERLREKLQDDFMRQWKREYLLSLRSYHEACRPDGRAAQYRIGAVILLQDDVHPRHMWGQTCITGTRPSRDGRVQTLTLRLSNGATISKPVQLVVSLEIDQGGEDVEDLHSP